MKLHLHTSAQQQQITGFDAESISINHQRHAHGLIVHADTLTGAWFTGHWDTLDTQALAPILTLAPEVVLLGSGDKHRFIHPRHLQPFLERNIAVECMTTAAACRTYNILTAEGRNVLAALLLEKELAG